MSHNRPFYGLANFAKGTQVRILDLEDLKEFSRTWRYHHKLEAEQLAFAGHTASVDDVFMYHGGDILYKLKSVPGVWHQRLLKLAS